MFDILWKPQPDINYNFIASAFGVALVIGIALYILDVVYAVESVHGYWIVFVPYAPCLLWVGYMKMQIIQETSVSKEKKS